MPTGIYKRTDENLKAIRAFNQTKIGKKRPPFSTEWKKNIGEKSKGRHPSKEFKKGHPKPQKAYAFPKGERHPRWKGGITPINTAIRNSPEGKLWKIAVFKRDNFTCVWCLRKKEVSGKLIADHIKEFALFPELRFAIDNGRTLCESCHKKRHFKRIPKGTSNL